MGRHQGGMSLAFVVATYRVEAARDSLEKIAEGIAIGLTVGSWTDLPATQQAEVASRCGSVEEIRVLEETSQGTLAEIKIGYPEENLTDSLASLLVTVFGKLSMDGNVRLQALEIPDSYRRRFPGPQFGAAGIRQLIGVERRPLIMSIFKSCNGQSLSELAHAFREQALGCVDYVKDDEIFFDESLAPSIERVQRYGEIAREVAEMTGQRTRYAVNLTGTLPELFEKAERLVEAGADALLLNVFAYGLDVLAALARNPNIKIPIFAHPAVSGAIYSSPRTGIAAPVLLGDLLRLAGADVVLYPSAYGSVTLDAETCRTLVERLRQPSDIHRSVLPGPAAGLHPGMVAQLYRDLQNECIMAAGGGIQGHPDGIAAGGRAFRQAIDAMEAGEQLEDAALRHRELARALQRWGVKA